MANRYWVGGSGTWDVSDATHWSATSGGTGGVSAPTSVDNVFFDQAATYTVTLGTNATCLDLLVTTGTATFAGVGTLSVWGSMYLNSTTNMSAFGDITFRSTTTGRTINTNGSTLACGLNFNGVGGGWSLASHLTLGNVGGNFTLTNGSFDMAGFNLTLMNFVSSGSTARTLTMGSGTLTVNYTSFTVNFTGFTLNAGTSTLALNGASAAAVSLSFSGSTPTFYTISSTTGKVSSLPALICTNLNLSGFGAGVNILSIGGNVVATNVNISGSNAQSPVFFTSTIPGSKSTISIGTWTTPADIWFKDIDVLGAAAPISPTRAGDAGNNTGITFPAAKTVYWNHPNNTTFYTTSWASTPTGAPAVSLQPLPQDTASIGGGNTPSTMNLTNAYIGSLTFAPLTSALTLTCQVTTFYGNLTLNTNVSVVNNAFPIYFRRYGYTHVLTSAGRIFNQPMVCDAKGGASLSLGSSYINQQDLTLTDAGLTTNNFNMLLLSMAVSGTLARTINLGSSTITFAGNATVWAPTTTNLTLIPGTSRLKLAPASTGACNANFGGLTYNDLEFVPDKLMTFNINGVGTFNNILGTGTSSSATVAFNASPIILTGAFTLSGTPGALLNITGTSTVLRKPTPWNVGINSVNAGSNSGLSFTGTSPNYLNISGIIGQSPIAIIASSSSHTQAGTTPIVSPKLNITSNDASHSQISTVVSFSILAINSANHNQVTSNIVLATKNIVTALGATQTQVTTSPTLLVKYAIVPLSATQLQTATSASVLTKNTIVPQSALQLHILDGVSYILIPVDTPEGRTLFVNLPLDTILSLDKQDNVLYMDTLREEIISLDLDLPSIIRLGLLEDEVVPYVREAVIVQQDNAAILLLLLKESYE